MFKNLKQLFSKKNKDLRKRIYFTLLVLTIYVIGISIEVPGTQQITKNLGFLELLNVMGGGALKNFSIFALGVSPYITASIIIQLLQMDIIPYFSELGKQGATGQQKLNQITRYVGILFAFVQGYAMSIAFLGSSMGTIGYLKVALIMTAGTAFLLWLGDQVTQKGLGNGVSLLIMAGIVYSLPSMMKTAFNSLIPNGLAYSTALEIGSFVLFLLVYLLIIVGVVWMEGAERRISIQYANKSTANLGKQTFMPIKINSAGVIPVIFASSLLGIPATIAQFINKGDFTNFVDKYLNYNQPVGFILFVVLIFFFAYFYTFVQMKPDNMAKNLQNNGGYIPGIRPGEATKKYFTSVLARLTVVGAFALTLLAVLPILVNMFTPLPSSVQLGGTGLLIVVGVAIETYKQLEGSLLSREYSNSTSSRRGRTRRISR
ncbi:MAG TPA: preprotein translocase subunit SecY [Bacilli bacterium]|nr:preprotein translocase subunit SecY [Bacilli bacterium]